MFFWNGMGIVMYLGLGGKECADIGLIMLLSSFPIKTREKLSMVRWFCIIASPQHNDAVKVIDNTQIQFT